MGLAAIDETAEPAPPAAKPRSESDGALLQGKPPRTWRPMAGWTLGILAVLGLAWFVGAVAVPSWGTRRSVDRCFSASLTANGLWAHGVALEEIERLGGREAAIRRLSLHLRLPTWLGLDRVTAVMILGECGPNAASMLIALRGDEDSIVRQAAADALKKIRDGEAGNAKREEPGP